MCLGAAGIAYTNATITFPELKGRKGEVETFPLGSVPVLTLPSGKTFCQSAAMARWAAKKAGLYPADDDAALAVDELIDSASEFSGGVPQLPDAAAKKAAREAWVAEKLPRFASYFVRRLGAGPFFLGASLSLADLQVFASINGIKTGDWDYISPEVLNAYPTLLSFHAAVKEHPAVVAHGGLAK